MILPHRAVLLAATAISLLILCTTIHAEALDRTALFVSGTDGYHTYRIPSILVTKAGTVLAFCEGRKDGGGDSGDIDMLVKRSEDGGTTWSDQEVIWDDGANTCGNPCPVVDQRTGTIWMLATWNHGTDHGKQLHAGEAKETRRVYVLSSTDDGRTWSDAKEITDSTKRPEWDWYATGPGNGIQLRQGPHKGRLVIPCDHTSPEYDNGSHTIQSDDFGQSWQMSNVIQPGCNECQVVELTDGTLMLNMRTQSHRTGYRAIATSRDGGTTWSDLSYDATLGDPVCQAGFVRYGQGGPGRENVLLFTNPSPPISVKRGDRIRLTVYASRDEGKTWPSKRLLHKGPSAYSCLTVLPDGRVGCLYEGGKKGRYENIYLATFNLDWVTERLGAATESSYRSEGIWPLPLVAGSLLKKQSSTGL